MSGRERQLDELESMVVSVISGTRELRRHGDVGWERSVERLRRRVAALARQLDAMNTKAAASSRTSLERRVDDDWLPLAAH